MTRIPTSPLGDLEVVRHVQVHDNELRAAVPNWDLLSVGVEPWHVASAYSRGVITEEEGDAFLRAIRKRRGR